MTATDPSENPAGSPARPGGTNVINTPVRIVGDRKTTGLVDCASAGGLLDLGATSRPRRRPVRYRVGH